MSSAIAWSKPHSASVWECAHSHAGPYLLTCMRYVEENPVRAGRVVNPGAYRWSSYPANTLGKLGFDYDWLLVHPLYEALGPRR